MPQVNIGVLISGSGSNLQSIIDNIETGNINGSIKTVISNKSNAYGLERAKNHGIDAVFINQKDYADIDAYNDEVMRVLQEHNVELVVLAGYLKILTKKFTDKYANKIINIHPSLIPSFCGKGYYGLKVHEAVVESGVRVSGATVHFVDENADTGPIIIQETVPVCFEDTKETLQQKVLKIEHKILPQAIKYYCDGNIEIIGRKVNIKK